jgi:uncharacterized repeat protein (TIGR01451 family)
MCALLDNGAVKCWGFGGNGQLGTGSPATRGDGPNEMGANLPAVDLGPGRTATAVTAGTFHTCALLDDATVKCWGSGANGRLGDGDTDTRGDGPGEMGTNLPTVDLGPGRTATAVTAGEGHTCALLDDGAVKCWGNGVFGALGYGDDNDRGDGPGEMGANLPAVDLGAGRTATAVTAGSAHTCALLDNGTVKCWGEGGSGELGIGTEDDRGDGPGEMGANLPPVDLSRLVGRARVGVTITADRASVVAGSTIRYTVSVRNTGSIPLTGVTIDAAIDTCDRRFVSLRPQATTTYTCTTTTTAGDVPDVTNLALVTTTQQAFTLSPTVRTRVSPRVIRADGLIRAGSGAFAGGNTYNSTGAGQTATATTARTPVRFTWRIQNDGNANDRFRLRGTAGTNRFTVTYRRGGTNITAAVRAGTFTTPRLAPGASTDVTVTVTPTRRARAGDTLTTTLTARSAASSTVTDTVRATTTRR